MPNWAEPGMDTYARLTGGVEERRLLLVAYVSGFTTISGSQLSGNIDAGRSRGPYRVDHSQ